MNVQQVDSLPRVYECGECIAETPMIRKFSGSYHLKGSSRGRTLFRNHDIVTTYLGDEHIQAHYTIESHGTQMVIGDESTYASYGCDQPYSLWDSVSMWCDNDDMDMSWTSSLEEACTVEIVNNNNKVTLTAPDGCIIHACPACYTNGIRIYVYKLNGTLPSGEYSRKWA